MCCNLPDFIADCSFDIEWARELEALALEHVVKVVDLLVVCPMDQGAACHDMPHGGLLCKGAWRGAWFPSVLQLADHIGRDHDIGIDQEHELVQRIVLADEHALQTGTIEVDVSLPSSDGRGKFTDEPWDVTSDWMDERPRRYRGQGNHV